MSALPLLLAIILSAPALAQVPNPEPVPLPDLLPPLPSPEDLLQTPTPPANPSLPDSETTITVERFEVVGSSIFSDAELAARLEPFTGRPLSLQELLQARTAITQLYQERGYVLSGAFIPPQSQEAGVVTIEVIEGKISEIEVRGSDRLRPGYVRRRLQLAAGPPLRLDPLVERLRLLQLDPLISSISAELATGREPGTGTLIVDVAEADTFAIDLRTDNDRTPSIGSWRRGVDFTQANLLGFGDRLKVGYTNTSGSNEVNASYQIPINARDGSLAFQYARSGSDVIEEPFDVLDIESATRFYEFTYRQPVVQTPNQELALSLIASRQESESLFLEDTLGEAVPFPSLGADEDGETKVSALRFAQDWKRRGPGQVLALRSQFSTGLDVLDATINDDGPDGRFFAWQGQAQWVKLLAPETLLLLRSELQIANDALVPLEQFGLGGRRTVRGYQQNRLLTDNAFFASVEGRIPIYRNDRIDGLLQVAPFLDYGRGWNHEADNPDPNNLLGIGFGLQWQQSDRWDARIDFGFPLIDVDNDGGSLQEEGIYFSVNYSVL